MDPEKNYLSAKMSFDFEDCFTDSEQREHKFTQYWILWRNFYFSDSSDNSNNFDDSTFFNKNNVLLRLDNLLSAQYFDLILCKRIYHLCKRIS